jgi:hypothetical protein
LNENQDATIITSKDLKIALIKAKGNSKELIEAEIDYGDKTQPSRQARRD